ncbi:hypothetical protein PLESTM_000074500, partial [Pleodorina starrii]
LLDMRPLERHRGEVMIAGFVRALGPLFFVFVLYAFVFAILMRQQRRLRALRRRAATVGQDLRNMFKWVLQKTAHRAPSNKAIDATIDWVTRPEVRYSWAYGMLYSAIVRSVAAMSGGTALARRHPKQHKAATERAILLPGPPGVEGFGSPDEPDPRVAPRYNLRALHSVFEGLLGANKELRRELFFFFNTNVKDT